MQCEMCGSQSNLFLARIEGTQMNVCKGCAQFGKVIRHRALPQARPARPVIEEAPLPVIVDDYSQRIRAAREKRNFTQEILAKKLHEKESIIQKMETGNFKPSVVLAKRLERFLGITLIEEEVGATAKITSTEAEGLTLGDLIKQKLSKSD